MLEFFLSFSGQTPLEIGWQLFRGGGWIVFLFFFFFAARELWLLWRQNKFMAAQEFVLLAVDIPKEHEQATRAVESIFASMWGSFSGINKKDKYIAGKVPLAYSIEIVSLEGYVQFLIRTPAQFRDIVEAAIYAQYPDSEVVEIEDYVDAVPKEWPAPGWDLWGAEYRLSNNEAYPIKTYPFFEDSLTQSFSDPLAALLEVLSKIGPGEQIWIQWVITPLSDDWHDTSERLVKKLIGAKVPQKKTFIQNLFSPVAALFNSLADILGKGMGADLALFSSGGDLSQSNEVPSLMQHLSPGERSTVEAVQRKAAKIGYRTKMRVIYLGLDENFSKARGAAGTVGALRQYSSLDLNSFRPHTKSITSGPVYGPVKRRVAKRQKKIMSAYRSRSRTLGLGGEGFIMNIEELASVWHFPDQSVRAPQLKRSTSKLVEPPFALPVERMFSHTHASPIVVLESDGTGEPPASPPSQQTADQSVHVDLESHETALPRPPSPQPPPSQSASSGPPSNLPV